MWVPNQIKLPHSPMQRVPKSIWIPLHYLTWSIKYSPYVMHWRTLDSEDCAVCQEEQYLQTFPSPMDAHLGVAECIHPIWAVMADQGSLCPCQKERWGPKNHTRKAWNSSSTEDWLPDPDKQAGTAHCCHTWARPSGKHEVGDSFCTYKLYH